MKVELSKNEFTPDPKSLLAASLKIGTRVELVLNRDEAQEAVDVRSSRLYGLTDDGFLVLAQTDPPLFPSDAGVDVEVTFLVRFRKGSRDYWIRSGYYDRIARIVKDFDLGTLRDDVILVPRPRKVWETNLRMHYRLVNPTGVSARIVSGDMRHLVETEFEVFVRSARQDLLSNQKHPKQMFNDWVGHIREIITHAAMTQKSLEVALLDISFGGAKLGHPNEWRFPLAASLTLSLMWEDQTLDLNAEVIRQGAIEVRRSRNTRFTSVRFVNNDREVKQRLNHLIGEINRRELARMSGLE
jgi:hypothetical protein